MTTKSLMTGITLAVVAGLGLRLAAQVPADVLLPVPAAAKPVAASIDATKVAPPVSRLVFGGFMEPATTGVWAEMLADRKFFAEMTSKPTTTPTGGFGRRGPQRRWLPVGPDSIRHHGPRECLRGRVEPLVQLEASDEARHRPGRPRAEGRAGPIAAASTLAGSPGARVAVSLVWGPNPADRQTVTVPHADGHVREGSAGVHGQGRHQRRPPRKSPGPASVRSTSGSCR